MAIAWNNVQFETSFGSPQQLKPSSFSEVAFSGRSNVGKSSLINKLFSRKALARVSSTPGKTITINFFSVNDVRFADLPGYGYAKRPGAERIRWSGLMEHYFGSNRNIKLVVQLIDMRHPPSKDDITMLQFLSETGLPFIIALTKSDKLNKTEREKRLRLINEELAFLPELPQMIPTSAQNAEGMDKLRSAIEKFV